MNVLFFSFWKEKYVFRRLLCIVYRATEWNGRRAEVKEEVGSISRLLEECCAVLKGDSDDDDVRVGWRIRLLEEARYYESAGFFFLN